MPPCQSGLGQPHRSRGRGSGFGQAGGGGKALGAVWADEMPSSTKDDTGLARPAQGPLSYAELKNKAKNLYLTKHRLALHEEVRRKGMDRNSW